MSAEAPIRRSVVVIDDGERIHEETYLVPSQGEDLLSDLREIVTDKIRTQDRPDNWKSLDHEGLSELLSDEANLDVYFSDEAIRPLSAIITQYRGLPGTVVEVHPSEEAAYASLRERLDKVEIDHEGISDDDLADHFSRTFLAPTGGTLSILELAPRKDGSYITEGM